jgi:hypothetical protein
MSDVIVRVLAIVGIFIRATHDFFVRFHKRRSLRRERQQNGNDKRQRASQRTPQAKARKRSHVVFADAILQKRTVVV